MIKVLIADDEPYFREFMRKVVDWESLGFQVVGIARNGREALKLAEEKKPDVYFLDINMPHTDGISLTECLREKNQDCIVVFITGYSKFEYARKALQLGVEEYILKPFSQEELLDILRKIKEKFTARLDADKRRDRDCVIVREHLWSELFSFGGRQARQAAAKLEEEGIAFCSDLFRIAVVEIDRLYETIRDPAEISLWQYGIANILGELLQVEGASFLTNTPEHYVVAVLNFADRAAEEHFDKSIYSRFCETVRKSLDFTVSVGIGTLVCSREQIHESYRNALAALQRMSLTETDRVEYAENLPDSDAPSGFYRVKQNERLLLALRENNMDKITAILEETKRYIVDNHLSNDFIYTISIGMLSVCFSHIAELGESIKHVLGDDLQPYRDISSCQSIDESFDYISALFSKTVEHFQYGCSRRVSEVIRQVMDYIGAHYREPDLSVEQIANRLFLDSSYLRRLFARQMNDTILGAITSMRMNEASLLISKGLTAAEVADRVGYSDPGYFNKCFKKHFGVTPGAYQRKLKG